MLIRTRGAVTLLRPRFREWVTQSDEPPNSRKSRKFFCRTVELFGDSAASLGARFTSGVMHGDRRAILSIMKILSFSETKQFLQAPETGAPWIFACAVKGASDPLSLGDPALFLIRSGTSAPCQAYGSVQRLAQNLGMRLSGRNLTLVGWEA